MSGATLSAETERLSALRAHEILDTGPDFYLEHLVRAAARRLRMPIAQINLVDADRQWTKAGTGLPSGHQIPRDRAFCAHTIRTPGKLTVIPDARLDPRVADNPLVTGRPGLRFYAGAPITDAAGRALGAICVIDTRPRGFSPADAEVLRDFAADVSARLELYLSNAGQRESEEHYRAAADLNPHMPWTASAGGEPEAAGAAWPSLAIPPPGPGSRQGWMQAVHPEDAPAAQAAWAKCLRLGTALDVEYRLRLEQGGDRWFRVRAAPKRDPAGGIMRWYGTVEDIDDRRRAADAQRETETLLRQALDVGRLRSWELDLASRRLTASDASVVHFGLQLGAEPSGYDGALARIHPDDQLRYGQQVEQAWLSGQDLEIEYRSLWPDGTTHWIRIKGQPKRDAAGKPVRLVGLSLDITAQRQAELERQQAEARLEYLAHHDPLTGLANRRLFLRRLAETMKAADGGRTVLFRIDIDDVGVINNAMGHPSGDRLLQHAAERLRRCLRPGEMLARYGGDAFAIVSGHAGESGAPERRAQELLASLQEPARIGDRTIVPGGGIGISVAPDDATDAEELVRNANSALSRTRPTDPGRFHAFKPGMDADLQDLAKIRIDLRGALERGELRLFYQPLVDLSSGRIGSFEALMRWQHPVRGLVSPADFIPIAEETGWILPFGAWALEAAAREAMTWPEDIGVAVNLSPVQFRSPHLLEEVAAALTRSGLPARRLELEVTESLLLQDSAGNSRILRDLLQSGVRITMDDFGSGYSSLGYLRRFPFDEIKIDRSLLRDLPDGNGGDAVVQAIVGLARSLGIAITAEGVETAAQLDFVRGLGCNHAQGYLLGRPVPASQVPALLAAWPG